MQYVVPGIMYHAGDSLLCGIVSRLYSVAYFVRQWNHTCSVCAVRFFGKRHDCRRYKRLADAGVHAVSKRDKCLYVAGRQGCVRYGSRG